MRPRLLLAGVAGGALLAFVAAGAVAFAQHVDVRRPATFVVGPRQGGSPTDRVDSARTGLSPSTLPSARIAVAWKRTVGASTQGPAAVDRAGNVYVIAGRGDVVMLSSDGVERWRLSTGLALPSPPSLLADDTVLFTSGLGETAGVARGSLRFRARVGRPDSALVPSAPLALDDGGAVVATATELALIDAAGNVRAHVDVGEPIAAPLLSARAANQPSVIAIGVSGAVYAWTFGHDVVRVGSFGGRIDGGAALANAHTLVAVKGGGAELAALDLDRGVTVTRAAAPDGLYLGPPAMRGETAFLLGYTDTDTCAVTLDASGRETARVLLGPTAASLAADGGVVALAPPPHAGPIADASGTVAFVTPDGDIGVATPGGDVETLGEDICPPPTGSTDPNVRAAQAAAQGQGGFASPVLSATGDHGFLVSCPTGVVAKVTAARRR